MRKKTRTPKKPLELTEKQLDQVDGGAFVDGESTDVKINEKKPKAGLTRDR